MRINLKHMNMIMLYDGEITFFFGDTIDGKTQQATSRIYRVPVFQPEDADVLLLLSARLIIHVFDDLAPPW